MYDPTVEDLAIYQWVLQKLAHGGFYDPTTDKFSDFTADILSDPLLREVYVAEFYRQLSSAIARSYGHDDDASKQARTSKMLDAMILRERKGGNRAKDDFDLLIDAVVDVNRGGLPIEYFYKRELWKDMRPPDDAALEPYFLGEIRGRPQHSEKSSARRLARKFRDLYPYLAARYIFGQQIYERAHDAMKDVSTALKRHGINLRPE